MLMGWKCTFLTVGNVMINSFVLWQHCTSEIANINHLLQLQAFVNETKLKKKVNNSRQKPAQIK